MKQVSGILLIILSVFTSCGIGSEEKCITLFKDSDEQSLDTLLIDSANRNSIYHAELRLAGEVKDTLNLGVGSSLQVELLPGKYDTLIYKGDWYADPMVLNTEGGKGSELSFCTRFYY
jgi:hypothetical protein